MNAQTHAFPWTPHDGETVHLRTPNRWAVPAGRYKLHGRHGERWQLEGLTSDARVTTSAALIVGAEAAGTLTPIAGDVLQRDAATIHLRLQSPLRGRPWQPVMRQDDASDLALFRAACEPGLGL